jgi:thioredoxin 2
MSTTTASDSTLVACAACGATNRVPSARLADDPVCGRCGAELLTGQPIELTDANFDQVVRGSGLPVVVDFWAPWCQPCLMLTPTIEALASEFQGRVKFGALDIDQNPNLAIDYNVASIPTIMVFKGGQAVDKQVGNIRKEKLVTALNAHLA